MEKNLNALCENSKESVGKIFRKYISEVDDAIDAYGFRENSYIDYAEDSILELESKVKEQMNIQGMCFINLEDSLKNTVNDIIDYTRKNAYERSKIYSSEQIDKKTNELQDVLTGLNTRFINQIGQI